MVCYTELIPTTLCP